MKSSKKPGLLSTFLGCIIFDRELIGSMCKQIRKRGYIKPKIRRKSYTKYERMDGRYPGDK
ncbi:hypothetical protein, partial [Peptostreptococcus stomatis]